MRLARVSRSFRRVLTTAPLFVFAIASTARAQGTISGRVLADVSNEPLADVRLIVVGTNASATTSQDGKYKLGNVRAGSVDVQVLRVGYTSQKKTVTVTSGSDIAIDFRMVLAVVKLQEIVTTATGQQRKVELGNALATISASKLVEETPIRNMGDLLTARAPSVSVTPGNYTGAGSTVRIRGLSSINNSGPPIYIVDGIRISAGDGIGLTGGGAATSRLNDILPQDIEDIEIVKGPSAATLYGTNAANGVVVITTKRGKAGRTNWNIQSELGTLDDRNEYPNTYANWGHAPGSTTAVRCTLWTISDKSCISDSLTSANILATPGLSPIALGNRNLNSVQASGGAELVRFFTAATLENETGPLKMPDFSIQRLDSMRVPIRDEWIRPSVRQALSVRANINSTISPKFDMGVTTVFFKTDQRGAPSDNNVNSYYYNALTSPGFTHPGLGFSNIGSLGQNLHGYGGFTPAEIFQQYTNEDIQRFGGTVTARWQPFTWLQNDGTTGVDLVSSDNVNHCFLNECADFSTTRQGNYGEKPRQQSAVQRQVHEHGHVAAEGLDQRQDHPWRRLPQFRERGHERQRERPRSGRPERQSGPQPLRHEHRADRDQNARRLRPGTVRSSRSDVLHGRRSHGSEQRVRHQVPARLLPEAQSFLAALRRAVVPQFRRDDQ